MSNQKIWNFWAPRYKELWVQKVSLKPTRVKVLEVMSKLYPSKELNCYMDVGCGVGVGPIPQTCVSSQTELGPV